MSRRRLFRRPNAPDRGQVLVLFALVLVGILGIAALAVDVGNAYASRRFYRAVADAAALAGAQDLQSTSRAITPDNRTAARLHALHILAERLGATSDPAAGACNGNAADGSADLDNCPLPGTPYLVSVKTPSPTCVSCNASRAVQVTVRNPGFEVSFARVFGQESWDVGATSVSGLVFAGHYALITLRPPDPLPSGADQHRDNISVQGTKAFLDIIQGDVGTNTLARTNAGSCIRLADGYSIDHYDPFVPPPPWNTGADRSACPMPVETTLSKMIKDPDYPLPSFAGLPSKTQAEGATPCVVGGAPVAGFPADYAGILAGATCYRPGVYDEKKGNQAFRVASGQTAYLLPGAYYFKSGLDVNQGASLLGGLVSNAPGVVAVIPQDRQLTANAAERIWLNLGGEGCAADACRASPAIDATGKAIKAQPGGFVLSIEVERDEDCFLPNDDPQLAHGCDENHNNTIKVPGNGQLKVAGIVYAPSDNVLVAGNDSGTTGLVGQLIAWTVTYTGNASLSQDYPYLEEVGVVRLDAACTSPSTPCRSP
jgi:Flp pilus assembly protein TadG